MTKSTRAVTFQSILCPVDFSNHSRNAVRYAAAVARRSGGRLVVLFVNDPLLLAAAAAVFHHRRLFVERTRNELARFVRQSVQIGPHRATTSHVWFRRNPAMRFSARSGVWGAISS